MIGWGALISEAYIPVSGLPLIVMISLRVAGGGWEDSRTQGETGDRMIGRGTIFRSRVAAIRYQVRVLRFRFGFRKSAIRHLSSTQSSNSGGSPGWPVAGLFHSVLHSALNAVLHAALRDRFRPPSSVIDSVICHRFRDRFSPPFVLCRQINHPPPRMSFLTPKPEKATK